jgi:hypothetical protein
VFSKVLLGGAEPVSGSGSILAAAHEPGRQQQAENCIRL